MRPGQLQPNEFENALLDRLAVGEPALKIVRSSLRVLSRTYTGVGSFTDFLVKDHPPLAPRRVLSCPELIAIPGLEHGLGFLAFWEGDLITLETFAFGDEKWDGEHAGFGINMVG